MVQIPWLRDDRPGTGALRGFGRGDLVEPNRPGTAASERLPDAAADDRPAPEEGSRSPHPAVCGPGGPQRKASLELPPPGGRPPCIRVPARIGWGLCTSGGTVGRLVPAGEAAA